MPREHPCPPLPPLGNDIVCRSELSVHPRFAARVLASAEFSRYLELGQSAVYLRKAWAAKEAGYKYLRQKDPCLVFSPARLIFHESTLTLHGEREIIDLAFMEHENYLYCTTLHPTVKARHAIVPIAHWLPGKEEVREPPAMHGQSQAVRLLACTMIGQRYGLSPQEITIAKDEGGAPYAVAQRLRLPCRLSLTHDGPFGAVALACH